MPTFTSVRLRSDAVERLRRLTRQLAHAADRDVTQSEALGYALDLAEQHPDRLAEAAAAGGGEASSDQARDDRAGK